MYPRNSITGCREYSLWGPWFIDAYIFGQLEQQARSYDLSWLVKHNEEIRLAEETSPEQAKSYDLFNKTAIIDISGPTTKYPTSFSSVMGGTSTLMVQKALREAMKDESVNSVMLRLETPGGTVNGAFELADDIAKLKKVKPIFAFADGQATSAGQLFMSQATKAFADKTSMLGSIGVMTTLNDTSEAAKNAGIKPILFASGKYKGIGQPGLPVTEDHKEVIQERVDSLAQMFFETVGKGRTLTPKFVQSLQAKVFLAGEAKRLNLIDDVCTLDEALDFAGRVA
jgi:signal peptide peptidase SppA